MLHWSLFRVSRAMCVFHFLMLNTVLFFRQVLEVWYSWTWWVRCFCFFSSFFFAAVVVVGYGLGLASQLLRHLGGCASELIAFLGDCSVALSIGAPVTRRHRG